MSSKEVTNLRKGGRLKEAYKMAINDYKEEQSEWTSSALFWVLKELFYQAYEQQDIDNCKKIIYQMDNLLNEMDDDQGFAEKALKTASKKLSPNIGLVEEADRLSKNDEEGAAFNMIKQPLTDHTIEMILHERVGWVVYRYIKKMYKEVGSVESRKTLNMYMQLDNPRPSMLHSQILNLASIISEEYPDFKFLPFLKLWGIENFSEEDFETCHFDGKTIQPLYARLFERCLNLEYSLDECIEAFTKHPKISLELLLPIYCRNQYFKIFRLSKENVSKALQVIEDYSVIVKDKITSNEFHSKILSSYIYSSKDSMNPNSKTVLEELGFNHFMSDDWIREQNDVGGTFPSLIEHFIKSYNKSLSFSKDHIPSSDFEGLLIEATEKYPDDDQIPRCLAKSYMLWGMVEKAEGEYRKLLLTNNKFYLWKELALATSDSALRFSALCKAILSEPNDEFLGEIHLMLAKQLIESKDYSHASRELKTYANTYQSKGWLPKDDYSELIQKIPSNTTAAENNNDLYHSYEDAAEEFVYSDITWTLMAVCEIYEKKKPDGKKTKRAKLFSSDGISVSVNVNVLKCTSKDLFGHCFNVKIIKDTDKYKAVLVKPSDKELKDVFEQKVGYVEYYNEAKNIAHIYDPTNRHLVIDNASFMNNLRFIKFWDIPNKDMTPHTLFASKIDYHEAEQLFPEQVGIVDSINENKALFHCVFGTGKDAVVKYSQCTIRPKACDVIVARYIIKKGEEGKAFIKVISIEIDNQRETPLVKMVEGEVRTRVNKEGKLFGFVDDYYIPSFLLYEIEEGDQVRIKVVHDGSKWRAVTLEKI